MRTLFVVLIFTEICLVAGPFVSSGINRPEASRAWYEWRENPNPKTKQAWESEKACLSRMNTIADSILLTLLAVNSAGLFVVGRKAFRKSNPPE